MLDALIRTQDKGTAFESNSPHQRKPRVSLVCGGRKIDVNALRVQRRPGKTR